MSSDPQSPSSDTSDTSDDSGELMHAPWEKTIDKILSPFEEFLHRQTTSGFLLMGMTVIALIIANGPLADLYNQILTSSAGVFIGDFMIKMSVHHWINDALMAVFFFVVGLELKREFLVGELANPRNAVLPIVAAIGGMVLPALCYYVINPTGPEALGWGIPMATDIAFAVGVMALLGARAPKGLVTFLVALAIVDDLGAVTVIAVFYTSSIEMLPLMAAGGILLLMVGLNLSGIRSPYPSFALAAALWVALYLSGVHATLAGVLGALTVPAQPKYDPNLFSKRVKKVMDDFDDSLRPGESIMTNVSLRTQVQALENSVLSVETPLQRLEHIWHMPVAFFVIPIFALANAGIPIELATFGSMLENPVMLGVMCGLLLGKFVGITGACWIALKLGWAELPSGTRFTQIAGASLLAAIGFTMSIFVAQLAFDGQDEILLVAKTGILFASLIAGIAGYVWLFLAGKPQP